MIKEIEIKDCGLDMAVVSCGGEAIAYINYLKNGLSVNSVFNESSKQFKTTDEALAYVKKTTIKFLKNILA